MGAPGLPCSSMVRHGSVRLPCGAHSSHLHIEKMSAFDIQKRRREILLARSARHSVLSSSMPSSPCKPMDVVSLPLGALQEMLNETAQLLATPASVAAMDSNKVTSMEREVLSCRIKGFYPFPEVNDQDSGLGSFCRWLFKDTHQGILVKTSCGSDRLFMDFMTEGGQSNPVWWDEVTKWRVCLGGSIRGEVRIRDSGALGPPDSKLQRLREIARAYDCSMNLYTSNCRIFAARMQREVERLNAEDSTDLGTFSARTAEFVADVRLAFAVFQAGMLPALYPLSILLICWDGLKTGL